MFNRKLKEKVEWLECKIALQENKIRQLECSHKSVKFEPIGFGQVVLSADNVVHSVAGWYDVVCQDCGKYIRSVKPEEKARMEYHQAKEQYNKVCGGSDDGKTREKQG